MQIALILILGFVTGVFSGLLGVGGGVIMVPAFTYIFHMSIQKAIGTSLAIIVPIALAGSLKHYMSGHVDIRILGFFLITALIGGWIGASFVSVIPASLLKKIFAVFLIVVAIYMLVEK